MKLSKKNQIINFMPTIEELQTEIENIKARNKRVEADKAWETSWARKITISILTYLVIVIFFHFASLPNPLINSIVPAVAFVLSTLTISVLKKIWLRKFYKKLYDFAKLQERKHRKSDKLDFEGI